MKHITAILFNADEILPSGRVYDKQTIAEQLTKYLDTSSFVYHHSNDDGGSLNLMDVVGKLNEVTWEGNKAYGKIKLLDTPKGRALQESMEAFGDDSVSFAPSGYGDVVDGKVINYEIRSIDVISKN